MSTSEDISVAIVDDDEKVRRALARLLRTEGYRVKCYASGAELLRSLPDAPPGCIVLDVDLPELNGFDVQRMLARAAPHIPVIMITGRCDADVESRAAALGAIACLRKPVDASRLIDALSEHCEV